MKSKIKLFYKNAKQALPLYLFTIVFVLAPLCYAVLLSFTTRTNSWNVQFDFTLENYRALLAPIYLETFAENIKLATIVTVITVLLGYPAGLSLGKMPEEKRKIYLSLLTFPFWINSIVRITGIIVILRTKALLGFLNLLYTFPAVVITMVYALLPFMVYSVNSVAAKYDTKSEEAARILGATRFRVFFDITLPLTAKGLLTGIMLTYVPCMGLTFISTLLGGGKMVLVGNLIEDQLEKVHNVPLAAALSVVLMGMTALVIILTRQMDPVARKRRKSL